MSDPTVRAVSFDFGQTLCDLDTGMLSRRLSERGIDAPEDRLEASVTPAWAAYDKAVHEGLCGHPWKTLMGELLKLAGVSEGAARGAVDWLFDEQPKKNLWRRPIPGMIELCRDIRRAGIPVVVISNSEGRLFQLCEELGYEGDFAVVADSGVLGVEKPDVGIFRWTADRIEVPMAEMAHVGDSYAADVEGALAAGMRAVWFRGKSSRTLGPRALRADDADGVLRALRSFGLPL